MAITSIGYDGSISESEVEKWFGYSTAAKYGVNAEWAFAATTVAGQNLQVRIQGGTTGAAVAWTSGLVDEMIGDETIQLEPIASGSRWDLIVMRRDYQPPAGLSAIAVIKGGATMALPERNTQVGVIEDQPLWLVKVTAGSSVPTGYVDLRVWARNGGCTANHDLVRSFVASIGTQIEINGTLWLRRVGANGSPEWHAINKDYVDFQIQDHGHHRLFNEGTTLDVGKDTKGGFVRSKAIQDRTYTNEPNVFVTVDGVLARSTTSMASQQDLDFAIQDHGHTRLNYKHVVLEVGEDGGGGFARCQQVYNRDYDASPNVYVTSNGTLGRATRTTSALKYKQNVRDHEMDPAAVLAIRPVIYDRPEGTKDEFGVIADESAHTLPELVGRDPETGEIATFHYDRLPVAQQFVLRDHEDRIARLESALADALAKLADK